MGLANCHYHTAANISETLLCWQLAITIDNRFVTDTWTYRFSTYRLHSCLLHSVLVTVYVSNAIRSIRRQLLTIIEKSGFKSVQGKAYIKTLHMKEIRVTKSVCTPRSFMVAEVELHTFENLALDERKVDMDYVSTNVAHDMFVSKHVLLLLLLLLIDKAPHSYSVLCILNTSR